MMVKICGITCREDAEAAVAAGAGALGFNFYPGSPRYIAPEAASELARLVPEGVLKVGVFVNEPAARISELAKTVPLDVVQLHGDCEIPPGVRVWKAVSISEKFDAAAMKDEVEAYLLDAPAGERFGGTGKTFDWNLVRGLRQRIVLAGGLGPDNVAEAVREVRPWGVDACSRLEAAPGKKDNKKVREFITNAMGAIR